MYRGRITRGHVLAGLAALVTASLFMGLSFAGSEDHRTLRLLLEKHIITQAEYDQAVQEEEREQVAEAQRTSQAHALTKSGLQFKIGGFAELDFISDNIHSFSEIIGNKPVVHSNTLAGANGQVVMSPRNSRITFDVRAPERDGIKSRYFASIEVGACCLCSRQEGRENLQLQIVLIPIAIGAPLKHTNFVIQSLDEAELDLVPGYAICRDALPVLFDQEGKLLEGPEPLPLELFLPAGEELARPAFPAIGQSWPNSSLSR